MQTHPLVVEEDKRRQRVQSAETSMVILKSLARLGGSASLTAIAQSAGESAAKVHRYLASLTAEGLVAQRPATQHYQLGAEAVHIGLAALPVALLAGLESLAGLLLAGVLVGVIQGLASAYLDPLVGGALGSVFPFIIMLLMLLIRPTGMFGWKTIERV